MINLTPIAAMALFGGAYFTDNRKAFLLPLIALFVSDLVLYSFIYHGTYGFLYQGWYVIYGIFALTVFIGKKMIRKVNLKNVLGASIVASLSHWIISDFVAWMVGLDITTGLPYTRDIAGFIKCYTLAIPYLQSFFIGTVIYAALMFGIFEFAKSKSTKLAQQETI